MPMDPIVGATGPCIVVVETLRDMESRCRSEKTRFEVHLDQSDWSMLRVMNPSQPRRVVLHAFTFTTGDVHRASPEP